MKRFIMMLLFAALPQAAQAADSMPLLYTRTNLIIMRAALPPAPPPMPWQGKDVPPENPGVVFDVEVRDAQALYRQKGWYNLSSPDEKSGVMMAFSMPGIEPIVRSAQYAPLDVLMINREGTIVQIVPNVMLAELQQEINPPSPVLAFLFLKGGTCEHLSINPGDIVVYKLFHRPPVILTAPPPKAKEPAPQQ